jgi:predicted branched-subunit amino acid permease
VGVKDECERRIAMTHKVCGTINAAMAVALVGICNFVHNSGEGNMCFFLIAAFVAVSVGCWKRRRWLVCLAAALILLASVSVVVIAAAAPDLFAKGVAGFVLASALGVTVLEIFSLFSVGKDSQQN